MTFNVSPETTERLPGDEKLASENKVPVLPPLVLLLIKNAPAIVEVAFMLNAATDDELVITEGLAVVAVPNEQVTRVELL